MRSSSVLTAALVMLAVGGPLTLGQPQSGEAEERFFRQQRLIDEQLQQQRTETAPLDSLLDWQWGGWLEYYLFHYDDGVQASRVVQRPGLAVWTRLRIDGGAHELFARIKLRYTYFNPGDQIDRQQDWWGPNFDQAWYQIDVGRAFRLGQPSDPLQLRARIGRQSVRFGTGYTLDMPQDAVLLDGKVYDLRVLGLFGKSIGSFPNIDRSDPVDSHSDRLFYGVQLSYEGWQRHVPFVYALWNNDRTDERPKEWLQNYSYDSVYFGVGARGELLPNLNYWAEGVFESGHSYGDGAFSQKDYIEAFGWDVGLEKLFNVPLRPRLAAEYMFASGDSNRLYSPTNAAGGNRGTREDTSFVGFGFRDTGMSLAPTMSNLHVWRIGGSLAPLEKITLFRDFEIGTNCFLYHKNRRRAAISDPLADRFHGYVGWEMDYFINWRLASDLSWTIRWGTFFPGSAFSDRSTRHFLFTGVTWSF
ncbi:MAG: alginate export family protein [Phycisphaerae bacterium]|nr:alginate export family protein [Phycisphaerae bacterium]